jgi:hypothetical protein
MRALGQQRAALGIQKKSNALHATQMLELNQYSLLEIADALPLCYQSKKSWLNLTPVKIFP